VKAFRHSATISEAANTPSLNKRWTRWNGRKAVLPPVPVCSPCTSADSLISANEGQWAFFKDRFDLRGVVSSEQLKDNTHLTFDHSQVVEYFSRHSKSQKTLESRLILELGSDFGGMLQPALYMVHGGYDPRGLLRFLQQSIDLFAQVQNPFGFGAELC
jgi:hypothetical protein